MKIGQWKWTFSIIGTTLGIYLACRYILPIVVPFIFAYFLAKMILPIIQFLHLRFRLPKSLSTIITVFSIVSFLGFAVICIGRIVLYQIQSFIQNIPVYQTQIMGLLEKCCDHCNHFFGWEDGAMMKWVDGNMEQMRLNLKTNVMPSMTHYTLQGAIKICGIGAVIFLVIIAVLMIIKDMDEVREMYEKSCFYKQVHPIADYLSKVGLAYLRAQLIIISLVTGACTLGLFLIHNEYALMISIGIGLFDAVPLLGSGSILVPWAIWKLITGKITDAAILVTLYICCQLLRQILEPKLIGDRIGIKPIFTLMAMYAGVKIFGLEGFFLGPIALVIIRAIVQNQC